MNRELHHRQRDRRGVWAGGVTVLGYFLGQVEVIKNNIELARDPGGCHLVDPPVGHRVRSSSSRRLAKPASARLIWRRMKPAHRTGPITLAIDIGGQPASRPSRSTHKGKHG
jgi:hypothetical protein